MEEISETKDGGQMADSGFSVTTQAESGRQASLPEQPTTGRGMVKMIHSSNLY